MDCPKLEEAFVNSYTGKVLGVIFDTKKHAWRLPEQKIDENCEMHWRNFEFWAELEELSFSHWWVAVQDTSITLHAGFQI
jgi:hypothetical protein